MLLLGMYWMRRIHGKCALLTLHSVIPLQSCYVLMTGSSGRNVRPIFPPRRNRGREKKILPAARKSQRCKIHEERSFSRVFLLAGDKRYLEKKKKKERNFCKISVEVRYVLVDVCVFRLQLMRPTTKCE